MTISIKQLNSWSTGVLEIRGQVVRATREQLTYIDMQRLEAAAHLLLQASELLDQVTAPTPKVQP